MLTVAKLSDILNGLDPDAPVIAGIINGDCYNAADAMQQVHGGVLSLYILCYEEPRDWEWDGDPPIINADGTGTLRYDPPTDDAPSGDRKGA
ncbi:MAG: hypothetical protein IT430_03800 [Phycisphaerales bacterium]|nr:hypothetical protein [Phycisphaerales bacterium]